MISSSKRISTKLFKEIMMKSSVFHGNFFIVRYINTQDSSRFAVSVPKKVAKLAVDRNKIRRRVYTAVRKYEKSLSSGKDIIFIIKNDIGKIDFAELGEEVKKIFVKLDLLK